MERKNIRFSDSEFGIKYLNKKKDEYGLKNYNETIERIFAEHDQFRRMLNNQDEMVERIYSRFKKDLDVIRVRTGYADKNTRIALELWNGFILTNDQDNYVTTDEFMTTPLEKATKKVTDDIAAYRQRKLEREKKKGNS
ncbi:hypothetical protein [Cytobacillus kochii]|uniref:hypothetical protein n=1 Tax=Cytobacillus kochii TaxID=859143 RepID=UPI001CD6C35D|nr:hypothetical protein [Cytobacillus kochii]MCA1028843.1 hypothetical protein [Cytobacillus kochii]